MKTVKFKEPKYVGDPINAVKIFNEKEVDELIILDIDASVRYQEPDYNQIAYIAAECRMPLCYGGGVKSAQQARKIVSLGVEKVAISSAIIETPELLKKITDEIGQQSVVVVIDVKKSLLGGYEVMTHNATRRTKIKLPHLLSEVESIGVGEIVVNSVDQDGVMKGYDLGLVRKVRELISVPLTILGGASSVDDIVNLVEEFNVIGASAGSLFVFKGKYKAVLISYLSKLDIDRVRGA